ncbi:MAG TPA: hybrid sensor histidine kinase/response regulator [Bryobacteraceae bacterium]|nr:hybrid sensor histidine kinase/response regulator [Bryobacteraceae bacterium]
MAQSDIMIVDDTPTNLKLLEDMLLQQGHEVRSFPLGRLALAAAARNPPDLVLLDINMPEMNGYEVCERLKANGELAGIPVLFLSALSETESKVKAFQAGGVDYISKPFQVEEVNARVETHLKLHQLQRELTRHNQLLEEAVTARTSELKEVNGRLTILDRSKSDFLNLISHEFRTPLNGLLGVGDLILGEMPATQENLELKGMFQRSRRRILSLLEDALLLAEIDVNAEKFKIASVSLHAALNRAIERATEFARSRSVAIASAWTSPDLVLGDEELLIRALHALLETAVKFSREGGTVRLLCDAAAHSPSLIIESQGKTIPESILPKFFNLFSNAQAITPGGDLGLGPPMAYRILSLFGASVNVQNLEPSGIRLSILLKNAERDRRTLTSEADARELCLP